MGHVLYSPAPVNVLPGLRECSGESRITVVCQIYVSPERFILALKSVAWHIMGSEVLVAGQPYESSTHIIDEERKLSTRRGEIGDDPH